MVLGGHTNMPCTLRRQTVPARLLSRVGVATDVTWAPALSMTLGPIRNASVTKQ